jgi:hypothetical protein
MGVEPPGFACFMLACRGFEHRIDCTMPTRAAVNCELRGEEFRD